MFHRRCGLSIGATAVLSCAARKLRKTNRSCTGCASRFRETPRAFSASRKRSIATAEPNGAVGRRGTRTTRDRCGALPRWFHEPNNRAARATGAVARAPPGAPLVCVQNRAAGSGTNASRPRLPEWGAAVVRSKHARFRSSSSARREPGAAGTVDARVTRQHKNHAGGSKTLCAPAVRSETSRDQSIPERFRAVALWYYCYLLYSSVFVRAQAWCCR